MALGLPLYGMLMGLLFAAYNYFSGNVGIFGAFFLYALLGSCSVLLGAVMVALREEKSDDDESAQPVMMSVQTSQ